VTLPDVLGQPLGTWAGPASLVVALIALGVALFRDRPSSATPVAARLDEGSSRAGVEARIVAVEGRLPAFFQHAALVRFDAFPGAGGQYSFSAALLDGAQSGLVLTAISGRDDTRLYAKWVEGGRCQQALSPEEQSALARALGERREQGRP
jgi:hypothetical protein